jgi:phage baseplate assembly protein gpV
MYLVMALAVFFIIKMFTAEAHAQDQAVGFVVGEQVVPINKRRVAVYPIETALHTDLQVCVDAAAATQAEMQAYELAIGQSIIGGSYVAKSKARCVSSTISVEAADISVENPCVLVLNSSLTISEQLATCTG